MDSPLVNSVKRRKIPNTNRSRIRDKPSKSELDHRRLEALPAELLDMIMGYLCPRDLLMLARTSSKFRKDLMSPTSLVLWTRARDIAEVPAPPPDCSEPKWANLLFGGNKCQNCGVTGASRVDFGLCRRVCKKCLKENLVSRFGLFGRRPGNDPEIWHLISYTGYDSRCLKQESYFQNYWRDDIATMQARLEVFKTIIDLQEPGALSAIEAFKNERIEIVNKTRESVPSYEQWMLKYNRKKLEEKRDFQAQRKEEIANAFVNIGYRRDDAISGLMHVSVNTNNKEMSAGAWTRARKKYEPMVIAARNQRLWPARRAILEPKYHAWMKTLKPNQWAQMPLLEAFKHDPTILDAFNSCQDIENPASSEVACLDEKFPEIGLRWRKDMAATFGAMVDKASQVHGGRAIPNALVVIECHRPLCLKFTVGLDEWVGHFWACKASLDHHFQECTNTSDSHVVSHDLSASLVKMLELIDKDPESTTPLDMDLLGYIFYCTSCTDLEGTTKWALNWRQMITHSWICVAFQPALVTDPAELELVRQQAEKTSASRKSWLCNHCSEFYQAPDLSSVVKDHLLLQHKVRNPVENQDYIWDFTRSRCFSTDIGIVNEQGKEVYLTNKKEVQRRYSSIIRMKLGIF